MGVHGNADIGEDSAEAYVQLGYTGTATIFLCVSEHGTGQKSNYDKLVAEVLQIPLENVSMTPADSLVTPFEFGPVGSRGHLRHRERSHQCSRRRPPEAS